jgi:hypothetical protein
MGSRRIVEVFPKNMVGPLAGDPVFNRGWPRYRFDFCFGVAAHETGHHIWHLRMRPAHERVWQTVRQSEPPVTMREAASPQEAFAESARLYILNAPLMLRARPLRWHFFSEVIGLRSMTDRCDWTELVNARAWIREGEHWIRSAGTHRRDV